MQQKSKNSTMRFLVFSLVCVSMLCIALFSFLAFYMSSKSAKTINEVGTLYISSMSEQISGHFETTIELRLEQVEALANMIEAETDLDYESARRHLVYNARTRNLDYLAMYTESGAFEMLCGDMLEVTDPQPFLDSMKKGEKKVAISTNTRGEKVVLLGVPAAYPMANGEKSIALVAGIPPEYITEKLALEENPQSWYSFIIRQDGSYIIRTFDAYGNNYFERVRVLYEDVEGKTAERYLEELQAAMAVNADYTSEFQIYGERRHLYCTRLPYSEWYLLTFMPYNMLDNAISDLGNQWSVVALAGCALILLVIMCIFFQYLKMTRRQIEALEVARQAAEHANKAKSQFLSNMSHDIRTPMNAIVGLTAIASSNIDNKQQIQDCLKKITLSSKHLLGLINDVLDMSKIESGKMTLSSERVSLRELMDSLVNIVQPQVNAKRQQFDVFIHDISVESVCSDGVRLNQVLLNLLSNAVKFTPEGGSIHVALYEEESPRGEEYIRVHFRVKDTGIGMSEEFRKKVFESFEREDSARVHRTEGTGLGMAITKYIVDAMGGTIDVASEQGKGTEFHVTLDLLKEELPEMDMVLPPWKMLVVDDDKQLCESTAASLHAIGIQADWTQDGESALEMVGQQHRKQDDYHIILLDWKMPGMDGIETAKALRRQMGDDIPILLISAYDWSEIEEEARAAGISGFISKPLFQSTLYYGLRPFVGEDGMPREESEDKSADLSGRRILLAEDMELNWEIARELLSSLGLELDWAENGQICVEMYQKSEIGYYDAILMDVRMPVMGGYEAARTIRGLDRPDAAKVPIIAMTADAFAEDVHKSLEAGMNAHTPKPINLKEVARLLEKYIE